MTQVRSKVVTLVLMCLAWATPIFSQDLSSLLSQFQTERDRTTRELILENIVEHYPKAGPALLKIAKQPPDPDSEWLAIRGIGQLKYKDAAQFLRQSLNSKSSYVRACSVSALREINERSATPDLIIVMKNEGDSGVIEQTSFALAMLDAKEAVPILKAKAQNPSPQTRVWVLDAVARLGSKQDVPFFADFLFDRNEVVAASAARVIEHSQGRISASQNAAPALAGLDTAFRMPKLGGVRTKKIGSRDECVAINSLVDLVGFSLSC